MTAPFPGMVVFWLCLLQAAVGGTDAPLPPPSGTALRGVYLKSAKSPTTTGATGPLVGRLAIKLRGETVAIDRPFRDGDEIQLEVSGSQTGWLFVFHRGPTGSTELLWPDPRRPTDNRLAAGTTRLIPDDGTLVFDRDTGRETFFVVISPEPDRPTLAPATQRHDKGTPAPRAEAPAKPAQAEPPPPPAAAPPRKQILVRSPLRQIESDLEAGVRGVSFRPTDGDRFVYFSVDAKGAKRWAIAQFILQHVQGERAAAGSPP